MAVISNKPRNWHLSAISRWAVQLSQRKEPGTLAALSYAYSLSGKLDSAYKIKNDIDELGDLQYVDPYYYAAINMGFGEYDTAIDLLEKGFTYRSSWMLYLDLVPIFDPIRENPRFIRLINKIGLRD